MNTKITTTKLLILYFGIRLFSYLFTPVTPLWTQSPVNTLVSFLILALSSYWIYKNDDRGWYIIAAEIIFGGAGGYLKIFSISLRTCLLIVSLLIYFSRKIYRQRRGFFARLKTKHYLMLALILVSVLSALNGFYQHHTRGAVISDLIPYFFFLYFFPLADLWLSTEFRDLTKKAIVASIIGNGLFILFTQIGFSTGIFVLQQQYYHWFRDVALGKITDIDFHFYRLVLNEHLMLVPLMIYWIADIIKNKINKNNFIILSVLLFILANNLTRIYMVALAIGMLCLFSFNNWKTWLKTIAVCMVSFVFIFTTMHIIISRGKSFGFEIFGLRLQSIATPQIEGSSLSRLLLLPKIIDKIKIHPIVGDGLGDTVTVFSPVYQTTITTSQFDWGYLEIWTEMGLFGLLLWIALIYHTTKTTKNKTLLAIFVSYLIINITSPALFHVFGVILLTILLIKPILEPNATEL